MNRYSTAYAFYYIWLPYVLSLARSKFALISYLASSISYTKAMSSIIFCNPHHSLILLFPFSLCLQPSQHTPQPNLYTLWQLYTFRTELLTHIIRKVDKIMKTISWNFEIHSQRCITCLINDSKCSFRFCFFFQAIYLLTIISLL